ncbi:hypothetical protein D3C86_2056540 [compost metagenome]
MIRPPCSSKTWPVTSADWALASQTTVGATLAGSLASKPSSGACMAAAKAVSVIRVRAAGARALAVIP